MSTHVQPHAESPSPTWPMPSSSSSTFFCSDRAPCEPPVTPTGLFGSLSPSLLDFTLHLASVHRHEPFAWPSRPKPTRLHPSLRLVHRHESFARPSPRTVDRHVAFNTCTSQARSNVTRNGVVNHSSHKGSEPPLVPHPGSSSRS